jgi:hypothetical protein
MRLFFLLLLLPFLGTANLRAQSEPANSALGALKLLPRGEAKRLARIEARDGTPVPERWHFIVHDPNRPRACMNTWSLPARSWPRGRFRNSSRICVPTIFLAMR